MKKRTCWISNMIDNRGEDFINTLRTEEVIRNADRIISDIINGRIDYMIYAQYMMNSIILDTITSYCENKMNMANANAFAITYTLKGIDTGDIMIANSNAFYGGQCNTEYDQYLVNNGKTIASIGMRDILASTLRSENIDAQKYSILYSALVEAKITQNVFVLQYAANKLNGYVYAHNRLTF